MSAIRSAPALQRLYERFRSATLVTTSKRPGDWMSIADASDESRLFSDALGVSSADQAAIETVRSLGALNNVLGTRHAMDVRLVACRTSSRGTKLLIRFTLVPHGADTSGLTPTPVSELPALETQANIWGQQADKNPIKLHLWGPVTAFGAEPPKAQSDDSKQDLSLSNDNNLPNAIKRHLWGQEETRADGSHPHTFDSSRYAAQLAQDDTSSEAGGEGDTTRPCLPDGSPLPDLSHMLLDHELVRLWEDGKLNDLDTMDALFNGFQHLITDVLEEEVDLGLSSMSDRFAARVAHAKVSTGTVEELDVRDTWHSISKGVVTWVRDTVRQLRDGAVAGQMLVLAPSPSTGKSHGMMLAAQEEQDARRRVGYAVLSRSQIPEVSDRLRASGVRLIVIEGRHDKNCDYMGQVDVATAAGFSPGSTVCPECPLYPGFGSNIGRTLCGYYDSRIAASRDRFIAGLQRRPTAVILTTHASAVQGSHISKRRYQNFWEFDTLFIDEDPTASMVQQCEIFDSSLSYSRSDASGVFDGPTYGTMVIRAAMAKALREREEAEENGFVNALGDPDRVHTRDYGSSYAGADLHALLAPVALAHAHTLKGLSSAVIDGMAELPEKGEIMNLNADEVAARFPNRFIVPLFAALDSEITAVAEAVAANTPLEPAYRVHLDLEKTETGHRAVLRIHELRNYANERTNLVIGDAYADIHHYEGLFGRFRQDGNVRSIKHRAIWPTSSTLVRIVTKASGRSVQNVTQLVDHLEVNIRPLLELERGRRVVFYIHLAMKQDFLEWLASNGSELGLGEFAVEHWGSGRGKDIYKDYQTFIAVTEYVPNIGALVHEANTVASLSSPGNTRVAHWSVGSVDHGSDRKGSMSFAQSIGTADPFFQAAFARKATDELAQAVHRIRPAIPSEDGSQKRAYVLGHLVPWTDELLAATSATAIVENGLEGHNLETEALGRGPRFSVHETFSLATTQEVVGTISEIVDVLGCWSNIFAHALMSVPSWAEIEKLVHSEGRVDTSDGFDILTTCALLNRIGITPMHTSSICGRVLSPIKHWAPVSASIRAKSRIYRAGLAEFLEARHGGIAPVTIREPWMTVGCKGYECWGNADRFREILKSYAPGAQRVPF